MTQGYDKNMTACRAMIIARNRQTKGELTWQYLHTAAWKFRQLALGVPANEWTEQPRRQR